MNKKTYYRDRPIHHCIEYGCKIGVCYRHYRGIRHMEVKACSVGSAPVPPQALNWIKSVAKPVSTMPGSLLEKDKKQSSRFHCTLHQVSCMKCIKSYVNSVRRGNKGKVGIRDLISDVISNISPLSVVIMTITNQGGQRHLRHQETFWTWGNILKLLKECVYINVDIKANGKVSCTLPHTAIHKNKTN